MKYILFTCFILFISSIYTQQSITFSLKNEQGDYLQKLNVYSKNVINKIGTTDFYGCIVLKDLKPGETLFLSVPGYSPYSYIVPNLSPVSPVELQLQFLDIDVDEPATFPGGKVAMDTFFLQNFIYPQTAFENGIQGKLWVSFAIDINGKVTDVKVIRSISECPECDKEAIRLIKLMPKWKPATEGGKVVKSYLHAPVTFKIQ